MVKAAATKLSLVIGLVLAGWGCRGVDASAPEAVADAFCEAYFVRADQLGAKAFTAFSASAMLDAEIAEVARLRQDGYGPSEAGNAISVSRGAPTPRDQRLRYPYEVRARSEGGDLVRHADVELAQVDGAWKVVRLGLEP